MTRVMTIVTKTKLKAQMLAIFREIEASGEELIVTDHGKPVLKIVPLETSQNANDVFADARNRLAEQGVQYSAEDLTEGLGDASADADWYETNGPIKPLDAVDDAVS